jgi:16S rRNA (cytosine1402-N4)-methyltransferase
VSLRLQHQTVLLREAVEALDIKPAGIYVDGTFGRGGHSRAILERLGPDGRLLALDRDPQAVAVGRRDQDRRLLVMHQRFGDLGRCVQRAGIEVEEGVDGVLLDIGVSSPQLDDGARASAFATTRRSTCGWIRRRARRRQSGWRAGVQEITEVIRNYGEERFAFQIAKKIVAARGERPLATTGELAALVRATVRTREPGQDAATRTFQALRIHINQELEQLALVLPQAMTVLKQGGRLVVISFHSLEDRIVKRFMRDEALLIMLPRSCPCARSICRSRSCAWSASRSRPARRGRRQPAGAQRRHARRRKARRKAA